MTNLRHATITLAVGLFALPSAAADNDASLAYSGPQELLRDLGVDRSYFERIVDGTPIGIDER